MSTLYLRATTKQPMVNALMAAGLLREVKQEETGTTVDTAYPGRDCFVDIGEIDKPTGEVDAEGMPVYAPISDESGTPYYHMNYFSQVALDETPFSEFLAHPKNPYNVLL